MLWLWQAMVPIALPLLQGVPPTAVTVLVVGLHFLNPGGQVHGITGFIQTGKIFETY